MTRASIDRRGVTLVLGATGCSVVSPPPLVSPHDAVVRGAAGSVSITAAGGVADGTWLAPMAGGVAAAAVQVTDALAVEASGGVGARTEPLPPMGEGPPRGSRVAAMGFGRVGVRHRAPARDWLMLAAGVGGVVGDTGGVYATGDLGASVGWTIGRRIRPYVGATTALSSAVSTHGAGRPTLWVGGSVGAAVRVVGALELGVDAAARRVAARHRRRGDGDVAARDSALHVRRDAVSDGE